MKNLIAIFTLAMALGGSTFAGECANGICTAAVRPVRKVVNVTREIVVAPVRAVGVVVAAPVRAVAVVAAPRNCCNQTVTTDCCGNTTKEVVKYQPLRRRLVNRSTSVSCCQ
jgi:hypothetical protein